MLDSISLERLSVEYRRISNSRLDGSGLKIISLVEPDSMTSRICRGSTALKID